MFRRLTTTLTPAVAAAVGVMLAPASALAVFRGTDVFGNIAPGGAQGLAARYPLSHYGLDFHVDGPSIGLGGISAGDVPQQIAQFIAALLWTIAAWLLRMVISVFEAAFNLDLVNGARGALVPIGQATQALYNGPLQPYFVVAVLVLGLWAMSKALVQRRYADAMIGLATSIAVVAIALLIILRPGPTIGTASQMSNAISTSLLSASTFSAPDKSVVGVTDHLFDTFVYRPWVVLEFGGLEHCVSAATDKDGFPLPVAPDDPKAATCRDHLTAHGGRGGYAPRWLKFAPDTDERNGLYDAMNRGQIPAGGGSEFDGWRVDKADAPAVDIQQAGGAYQRLGLSALVFAAVLGVTLVLGLLAFVALIAQVVALALLAMAPAALLAGVVPGKGHALFRWWLGKLGTALLIKAVYALLLAVLVTVSIALTAAAAATGFLLAFGLQTAFFWTVFLKRKVVAQAVMHRRDTTRIEQGAGSVKTGTAVAAGAVGEAAIAPVAMWRSRQEKIAERKRVEESEQAQRERQEKREQQAPATGQKRAQRYDEVPVNGGAPAASTAHTERGEGASVGEAAIAGAAASPGATTGATPNGSDHASKTGGQSADTPGRERESAASNAGEPAHERNGPAYEREQLQHDVAEAIERNPHTQPRPPAPAAAASAPGSAREARLVDQEPAPRPEREFVHVPNQPGPPKPKVRPTSSARQERAAPRDPDGAR